MQLTVRDVARYLNVSEKTVYRWIRKDALPAYKISEQFRFNRAELVEWVAARKIEVSPDLFTEPENNTGPLPSLCEAIEAGGIYYRVEGRDRSSALQEAVALLRLPESLNRDYLYQILIARERLSSTGIGDGIAVPHARNPIILQVEKPSISLCLLEHPVDFKSIDGKPVHSLFLLISPTIRVHLHLLARLAFSLRDPELKAAIEARESRDCLLKAFQRLEITLRPEQSSEGSGEESKA